MSPNDSRLISYAVDLQLVALQDEPKDISSIVKLTLSDGVLTVKRNLEMTRSWTFKNKSGALKSVLLQVPDEGGWKLVDPKQLEGKAAGVQRFRIAAKPGETKTSIKWIQTIEDRVQVDDVDTEVDDIVLYLNEKSISPALKAKLSGFVAGKRKLAELERQRGAQEVALKEIGDDQARIRSNMQPLDKTGKLFKSYEAKLGEQEQKIERVREEIARLREAENATRVSLRQMLAGLDVE